MMLGFLDWAWIVKALKRFDAYRQRVSWLRRRFRGRSWRPLFPSLLHAYAALSPFGKANRASPAEKSTPRILATIGG